jgi:hypothetical protein
MNESTQNGAYHEREANGNLWRVALFKNFCCGLICQYLSRVVINGMPQPSRIRFLGHMRRVPPGSPKGGSGDGTPARAGLKSRLEFLYAVSPRLCRGTPKV